MPTVQDLFDDRLAEVEQFIRLVRRMQTPGVITKLGMKQHQDFLPMLKACIFLLIYNAVESCVRLAFADVYAHVKSSNASFEMVSPAFQKIWVTQQIDSRIAPASANRDTYLSAVSAIAMQVSTGEVLDLSARDLPISGNLNADLIRDLCRKHGVHLKTPSWAKGGFELETIKQKRNALAHGHVSFIECGREYALNDLERMTRQTKHFMRGLLRSVDKFTTAGAFKAVEPA